MTSLFLKLMTRFVAWLDPKLDRFRAPRQKKPPFTPKTEKAFAEVIKRTPDDVLSAAQRTAIASAMSYQSVPVSKIMAPLDDDLFIDADESLGALTLDRLYKTGATCFPVRGKAGQIIGVLRPEGLDSLSTATHETKVSDCMERNVYYVRSDYSLEMLLATFLRTNNSFCIVVDKSAELVGYVTLEFFLAYFFGLQIADDFEGDADPKTVATRRHK